MHVATGWLPNQVTSDNALCNASKTAHIREWSYRICVWLSMHASKEVMGRVTLGAAHMRRRPCFLFTHDYCPPNHILYKEEENGYRGFNGKQFKN
jgi:hypothetical protein